MSEESLFARLGEHGNQITKHLVGKIVTLLDSVLADERQAKAAKDLAKTMIWDVENERAKAEEYILNDYRRSPEIGIFPEWKEKDLKERERKS